MHRLNESDITTARRFVIDFLVNRTGLEPTTPELVACVNSIMLFDLANARRNGSSVYCEVQRSARHVEDVTRRDGARAAGPSPYRAAVRLPVAGYVTSTLKPAPWDKVIPHFGKGPTIFKSLLTQDYCDPSLRPGASFPGAPHERECSGPGCN